MNAALRRRLVSFVLAGVAVWAAGGRDARAEPDDALPEFNPLPPLVPREPPKTTFGELGVSAGFTNDSTAVSTATWWKTTNGGSSPWPKQGLPQPWASSANVPDG